MPKEEHPFEPFVGEDATKLIIGTIPPPRFAKNELKCDDVNFYYGSRDNKFWDIIGQITNIDFKKENSDNEVQKRKQFLKEHKIGICDIVLKTKREKDSALDKNLKEIEHLDIVNEILLKNPQIDTLIYTSDFVKKQMTALLKNIFKKEICHNSTKEDKRIKTININGKEYKVYILYSPSKSALRGIGKNASEIRLEQYKKFLFS